MAKRPENVGILAMEVYIPTSYVRQEELEDFDGASKGKYTIGLGQESLGFCTDVEDVISLSLTVVKSLLEKFEISPQSIGRLEVGSETVIDKSKSIKTNLMDLFEECGNADIEGVDSTNACYGGTAALLNCINWVESSAWDGRLGIVVAADIAVYAEGPARPTGGAGAVAMLIGPNAPVVMESKLKSSHMSHAYDFYKPDLASEYPVVDGKLTQSCFLRALDLCYRRLAAKFEKAEGRPFSLAEVDYFVSHAPYNKLVQKSFSRLLYNDFLQDRSSVGEEAAHALEPFAKLSHEESLVDRNLEKAAQQAAKKGYEAKVAPATLLPKRVGNMYCASLYAGLASLLHNKSDSLVGSRVLMFSYGSGLASSSFVFRIEKGQDRFSLPAMVKALDISKKIETTFAVPPAKFASAMHVAETRYGAKDFVPAGSHDILRPGTYYLTKVDALFRRSYARKPTSGGPTANGAELANGFK